MSDIHLSQKSSIKEKQLGFITKRLVEEAAGTSDEKNELTLNKEAEEIYLTKRAAPLFEERRVLRHQLPFKEELQWTMEEISQDISILNDESKEAATFLKQAFNLVHSEKNRLAERIDGLSALAGDLLLLTGDTHESVLYIKESFKRSDSMDHDFSIDSLSKTAIQTEEGVLTLGRNGSKNLSSDARISHLSGNGESGMDHIARRFTTTDRTGSEVESYQFLNAFEPNKHTETENILDERPDTLFEYQRVNVPESFKRNRRYYDFNWAKGQKEDEPLRLKLIVELKENQVINWVTLHPYYADSSSGKLVVKSIQTSENGFDYTPLYEGQLELNQDINATPQTYRLTDLFDGENDPAKGGYSGKGVWSFPQRRARFIEFVIDQPQSYPEVIGQAVYTMHDDPNDVGVQVPEPDELKNQQPGDYSRTVNGRRVIYRKEIQATPDGWRYAIGLRDINIMQFQYDEQSYFISKRHELPRRATRVLLYAKEIIPESYLDVVSKNNDWVEYEVSFDDLTWHRISPMHHEPLRENFPPKMLEVNNRSLQETDVFQIHKKQIETTDATHIRLRMKLKRPTEDGFEWTSPLVEDVALKVEMEEESL